MYRPKEIVEKLGVSTATLRRWSDTFSDHLSSSAGKSLTESGGAAQRRYTDDDLVILARVKLLLDGGHTYEEAARKLSEPPTLAEQASDTPNTETGLLAPQQPLTSGSLIAIEAFREALVSKDQTISAMEKTIATQNELIAELKSKPQELPPPVATLTLPPMTFRQRVDWLLRGRMLEDNKIERRIEPEGPTQRSLPRQEQA